MFSNIDNGTRERRLSNMSTATSPFARSMIHTDINALVQRAQEMTLNGGMNDNGPYMPAAATQENSNQMAVFTTNMPLAVRPPNNPSGQTLPPFAPRWQQIYSEDTSEPIVINTLALDIPGRKHTLNVLWEQLDGLKYTCSSDDKKFKTAVIAEAKQLFQNALDEFFLRDGEGTRVRLGYFFRSHVKGFMISFRSEQEVWLARDHANGWLANLHLPHCGGFGVPNQGAGHARLFEIWGGIILKNVQLSEDLLKEIWSYKRGGNGGGNATGRDRPRFGETMWRKFEEENTMWHTDGVPLEYRVRRIEYLGGARRGHTVAVFFHDRDTAEYFFCNEGLVKLCGQTLPVTDFYRQTGIFDTRWEGRNEDIERIRVRNMKFAREFLEEQTKEDIHKRTVNSSSNAVVKQDGKSDGNLNDSPETEHSAPTEYRNVNEQPQYEKYPFGQQQQHQHHQQQAHTNPPRGPRALSMSMSQSYNNAQQHNNTNSHNNIPLNPKMNYENTNINKVGVNGNGEVVEQPIYKGMQ
ncbi:hypothetical protein BJ508DRAFT_301018 [Ascobolus immersus RN42]|uniref:Uncharacterized protein n=1 Tax=Ascobolus immersus RN42 TaxID=1160509 RepID=A0A3N4IPU0_ASCIM|nr:hypothetical protein BJ508DRAFT_301018 [Ascobolus immersus RN42]